MRRGVTASYPRRRPTNKQTFKQISNSPSFLELRAVILRGQTSLAWTQMIVHQSEVSYVVSHYWGLGQV